MWNYTSYLLLLIRLALCMKIEYTLMNVEFKKLFIALSEYKLKYKNNHVSLKLINNQDLSKNISKMYRN